MTKSGITFCKSKSNWVPEFTGRSQRSVTNVRAFGAVDPSDAVVGHMLFCYQLVFFGSIV